jgi:hypothetical protein
LTNLSAVVAGIAITCIDLLAAGGEISSAILLILLFLAGGFAVVVHHRFSIFLPVLLAIWLPATHLALHALGHKTTLQPDSYLSILMVGVVALFAAAAVALTGSAIISSPGGVRSSK